VRHGPVSKGLHQPVHGLLGPRPARGTLVGQAHALRAQPSKKRSSCVLGASALTAAELRLLPLLSPMCRSRDRRRIVRVLNTVKSEVNSIYRKTGASSRSQAAARAGDLGLLDR